MAQKLTIDEFVNRAILKHGNLYDYSGVIYIKSNIKIDIGCSKHGIFSQIPNNHLNGSGCPKCNISKGENSIMRYLIENNFNFIHQYKFENCKIEIENLTPKIVTEGVLGVGIRLIPSGK